VLHTSPPRRCAAAILALALAVPAAAQAESANRPVPRHATYAWAPINAQMLNGPDARLTNPKFQGQMKSAIDHGLAKKGLKKVDGISGAQLLVAYHVGVQSKNQMRAPRHAMPAPPCASPGCAPVWGVYGPPQADMTQVRYVEGTLIVDLMDRQNGQLVWRGTSKTRLRQNQPTDARVQQVVDELMSGLQTTH
jgi:hypothetical protein